MRYEYIDTNSFYYILHSTTIVFVSYVKTDNRV